MIERTAFEERLGRIWPQVKIIDKNVQSWVEDAIWNCFFNSLQYSLSILSNIQNSNLICSLIYINKTRIFKQFFSLLRRKPSYAFIISDRKFHFLSWPEISVEFSAADNLKLFFSLQ